MNEVTLKIDTSQEKNGLILLTISGMFETEDLPKLTQWAEEVQQTIYKAHIRYQRKIKVLIDIRNLKGYSDPKTLTVLGALMKADNPHVIKTASFGGSESQEMAQEVIKAFAGRDNLQNFKTEEEARNWLEQK